MTMISVMRLSLVLFFTISFGDAFFKEDLSMAKLQIYGCRDAHRVNATDDYSCYDNDKLESCLKKITPEDESDKKRLDSELQKVRNFITECPGFQGKTICREGVSIECRRSMTNKLFVGDKSVCNEFQKVRDCLTTKLNDSCTDDVMRDELSWVEKKDQDCKTGNFNGGPCGKYTIYSCNMPIYMNDYKCDDKAYQKASKCLADLDKKCKTKDQQKRISVEKSDLYYACKT